MAVISKSIIFKLIVQKSNFGNHGEIALRWMPPNLTNDKSILVYVMAWCHQAARHYQSQHWPRYLSSYGVSRPQWVNVVRITTYRWWFQICCEFISCESKFLWSYIPSKCLPRRNFIWLYLIILLTTTDEIVDVVDDKNDAVVVMIISAFHFRSVIIINHINIKDSFIL